jgi:UDP-N-acetylglucosamine transferase subunit ALG13
VIFVTVGTHQQPFTRLTAALERLPADELVVQHGAAPAPRGVRRAWPFVPFPRMLELFDEADVVITHAGVGSILCATNAGHVPIVVPRLKRYGEHIDDHQLQLIQQMERRGAIIGVWDLDDLEAALVRVPPRRPPSTRPPGPLQAAIRAAIYPNASSQLSGSGQGGMPVPEPIRRGDLAASATAAGTTTD